MTLFAWPKAAAFGRVIPKSKIYEHASASSALKERFVQQVEQIIWAYKLAPETVNLPATATVTEIQIVRVTLKGSSLDQDLLKAIDRAIPFPLIFELINNGRTKLTAAYKRPSDSDAHHWVVGNYFETDWWSKGTLCQALPVALDIAGLYEQLMYHLISIPSRPQESLTHVVERVEQLQAKKREIDKITARLKREKQFNRKIEINAELRQMKAELKRLK